jgi:glyoxylase-like metal-dependent hydrolase (beta-lactamase superfamily II)
MMEFKLHRIGLSNVSAYLLHRPGEAVLVDCGNAGSETRILKDLDRLGLAPSMLRQKP